MTAVPRSVIRIQSPWRQTPGYISKYASRSRAPSASSQKYSGIDGIGCGHHELADLVDHRRCPSSSNACRSAPSARACSSPS